MTGMERTGGQRLFRLSLMNFKEYHIGPMITSYYSGAFYGRETGQPITLL